MPALNAYLVRSTVVAALGGLLFGFDTAVIAGTTADLSSKYNLTPATLGTYRRDRLVGNGHWVPWARDSWRLMGTQRQLAWLRRPLSGVGTRLWLCVELVCSGGVSLH